MARRIGRDLRAQARRLRLNATGPEQVLWLHLRRLRLDGLAVRRQHPIPPYIVDFYVASARLAIEIDGRTHRTDEAVHKDAERDAFLQERGIEVVRYGNDVVLEDPSGVAAAIGRRARTRREEIRRRRDLRITACDGHEAPQTNDPV